MPDNIGACIRSYLNKTKEFYESKSTPESISTEQSKSPSLKKFDPLPVKREIPLPKNEDTNTKTSAKTSLPIEEVKDKRSLTHSKKKKKDWSQGFSQEEKGYLDYLLIIKPERGDPIEKNNATWWIKHFGIEKIKTALQVYWQQVSKAKENSQMTMPESIGAYVRKALNEGIKPCRESDRRNKSFAEKLKLERNWRELIITEKYCRINEFGKEWYYHLPEQFFVESLLEFYKIYCDYQEQSTRVA